MPKTPYTVLVYGDERDYSLHFQKLDGMADAAKGELTSGESNQHTLSDALGDRWTFNGNEGQVVTIIVQELQMRVRGVFVALGDSQASSGSSNEDAAFDLAQNLREQLVEGKDFDSLTVDTQTHPGSSVADSFDVWVSERDLEDEDVSLREAILTLPDGEISEPIFDQNRRGFYLFQVPERTLGPASSGQYVRLYDPDNRLIAEDSNHLRYIGIPDSGTYTLLVSGNEGDYGLYLEQLDNMAEGAKGRLSRGDVITDTISMVGGDRWTFSGAEGNNVLIAMSSVELDTYLELYDPTSGLIAQDDDGGGAENSRIAATLPISGTYTVVATGYGGYERGSYSLSLKAVEGDH